MLRSFQRATFEASAHLPPLMAGLCAGFLVVIGGQAFLTPAGAAYLENLDNHPDKRDQTYDEPQIETPSATQCAAVAQAAA